MQAGELPTISEATVAALAEAAGLELPEERLAAVAAELTELLALAGTLDPAALEGFAPALSPQRWR